MANAMESGSATIPTMIPAMASFAKAAPEYPFNVLSNSGLYIVRVL